MSSQKGNLQRNRPQKHQNLHAFKNSVHDTSKKTKRINSLIVGGVCQRCKDAIDWKIKYKKYKPLTQPKTCTKCRLKTVKQAYYTICIPCAQDRGVCQKCGEQKDIVQDPVLSPAEQAARDAELQFELKRLSERQRRTFFRLQESGKLPSDNLGAGSKTGEENLDIEDDLSINQASGACHGSVPDEDYEEEDHSDQEDILYNKESADHGETHHMCPVCAVNETVVPQEKELIGS